MYLKLSNVALGGFCIIFLLLSFVKADKVDEVVLTDGEGSNRGVRCTNPVVRREWRALSRDERADYIRAINCLNNLPHTSDLTPTVFPDDIPPVNESASYFDDLVYLHMDLNWKIHYTGHFFPWHRWYINAYETAMREKCGFQGVHPYWNWSIDASDFEHSSFWQDSDPISGLGGWGDPTKDYAVQDGGFAALKLSYPLPHVLRRNYSLQPFINFPKQYLFDPYLYGNVSFTIEEVSKMVNGFKSDFGGFQAYLASVEGSHASIHFSVGGDVSGSCPSDAPGCVPGATFAPNDPLFFMHHAMVDKIWYDWQRNDPANFWAFAGGSVCVYEDYPEYVKYPAGAPPMMSLNSIIPADGMFPEVTVYDVMNTTAGYLCYVYE